MNSEVKEFIDNLNEFTYASFWDMDYLKKKKKRFDKEIIKIKKMLIDEGLL